MKEIAYEYVNINEFKRKNRKVYIYTAREPASDDDAKSIKKVKTMQKSKNSMQKIKQLIIRLAFLIQNKK